MPRLIVSVDGVHLREVPLTKSRTTLGRRAQNDVVIDNLMVSGAHAVVHSTPRGIWLEDLDSTNGTQLNGKPVQRALLQHGDRIEIGRYALQFVVEGRPVAAPPPNPRSASLQVLNGAAAGRELPLTKPVTTLGKPGVGLLSIHSTPVGYVVAQAQGDAPAWLNDQPLGREAQALHDQDEIRLADARIRFNQPPV